MDYKFCPNCGAPLQPGMKFCPYCGGALSQENSIAPSNNVQTRPEVRTRPEVQTRPETRTSTACQPNSSQPQPKSSKREVMQALALVAGFITLLLLVSVVYDSSQSWYLYCGFEDPSRELMNSMGICIFTSLVSGILVAAGGIRKITEIGNILMLVASFVTCGLTIYFMTGFEVYELMNLFTYLLIGWTIALIIYLWTTIFSILCRWRKIWAVIICIAWTALFIFCFCLSLKYIW